MSDIPFPPESAGLTADDIPYGYSHYRTIWDDKRGYKPVAVGTSTDENGRQVIKVALSPSQYIEVTMVSAGWGPGEAEATLLGLIANVAGTPDLPAKGSSTGSARASLDRGLEKETGE